MASTTWQTPEGAWSARCSPACSSMGRRGRVPVGVGGVRCGGRPVVARPARAAACRAAVRAGGGVGRRRGVGSAGDGRGELAAKLPSLPSVWIPAWPAATGMAAEWSPAPSPSSPPETPSVPPVERRQRAFARSPSRCSSRNTLSARGDGKGGNRRATVVDAVDEHFDPGVEGDEREGAGLEVLVGVGGWGRGRGLIWDGPSMRSGVVGANLVQWKLFALGWNRRRRWLARSLVALGCNRGRRWTAGGLVALRLNRWSGLRGDWNRDGPSGPSGRAGATLAQGRLFS